MWTSRSSSSTENAVPGGLLEVGRVGRAHGTGGEVLVTLVTNRVERLAPGSELQTDAGVLRVLRSRPHQKRHLVAFDGVASRSDAETLTGLVLRAAPIDDADEMWVHQLIGARVVDADGVARGEVAAVVANPAGDMLELSDGALVPLRFVVGWTPRELVEVEAPEGLFDLGR